MTTNHRPTLESKSGKAIGITNTITHSRALPQQTHLKYRNDTEIDSQVGHRAVEDLKRELLINEGKLIETKRAGSFTEDSAKRIRIENSDDSDDEETELLVAELAQLKKESGSGPGIQNRGESHRVTEPGSIEVEKDEENEETSSESDSDDADSDEENRLLLEELAKIKQERLEKVKKTQQEEKTKKAMSSNPLVSISDETAPESKKSWRNSTAFNRKPPPTKGDSESFTNDTLKSEIHQKFLSKYIR